MQDHNAPPLNPLPAIVWVLALPIIAMEVVLAAGAGGLVGGPAAIGWRIEAPKKMTSTAHQRKISATFLPSASRITTTNTACVVVP